MIDHPEEMRHSAPSRTLAPVRARAVPVALIALAFLVRIATLDVQGLWRDEVDQWRFALQPLDQMIRNFMRPEWNGPLYSPLLRGWIALTGERVFAMRFLSLLFGILSVALIYTLARRLAPPPTKRVTAASAALLMALSPYMVWYAQEIKMYTLVPMLVLLAVYALDRACVQTSAGWWLTVLVATTLAIYAHILAALLLPVLGIWFLLHPRRHRRAWVGGGLVAAALTLPYLPLLRWQLPAALAPRQTGFPDYTLGQMTTALLNGWSLGISQGTWGQGASGPALTIGVMALLLGLVVVGLGALVVRGRAATAGRMVAWPALPLLGVWAVSLRVPIFTDRYLIWAAPAFYLLVGVGVGALARWQIRGHARGALAALALIAAILVQGHGLYVQAAAPIKPEFAAAVDYVTAHRGADAEGPALLLFQIPYNHHVFDYYLEDELSPWADAPFTNWRFPDGTYQVDAAYVNREMRRLLMGHARVWLIYSEVHLWDDRELVKAWLDEHYVQVDAAHVHGVSLYAYERPR